ncbi:hypothetical protein N7519_002672 [Penicillium mononematosum]|uniref:uncharacterized protein n=1 Tax=Penicillium mononematosum TaxID=268346 RepID=UPI002547ED9B|nr:uncharacterized protein N7519_002672 [Penicillium mononematosum]KAJ6187764.1 hypothetical protein N7519_002672 [Penicillium mononematosum]
MGTRGLEIVRFCGRYYICYHQFDTYFEGLGAKIVASIPADPEEYHEWLESMRTEYAAKESALERHVYEIRDGFEPDYSQFSEFTTLPSELPRLNEYNYAQYIYIINLDHEVLTMNYGIHWKLGNIPRQDGLWLRAIADSIYGLPTISLDICPEEHMASPALEYPEGKWEFECDFRPVTPRTDIAKAPKAFLTHVLAGILIEYEEEIIRTPGWVDEVWAGDSAPLLEFGSPSHRPGEPPGASPMDTMYWLEDILVSLALVIDGEAITKAATWGIEQGRANFQIVILSLFEVAFAEVSFDVEVGPFIKVSYADNLSPLRPDFCSSTHPRERPVLKPEMQVQRRRDGLIMESNCTGTIRRLGSQFPGLAALVNFFEVAASRRAVSKSQGILPTELYDMIVDFVDYDTWKACLLVSSVVRACCLRKYRLDDRMRIVAGPFERLQENYEEPLMSFNFENMQTGEILPMRHVPHRHSTEECNWMPLIGSDRKALMVDVVTQFEPVEAEPVEADGDDECARSILEQVP